MSPSRQRAPMRATRAAMFAAVCVALAAVGHSSMSGMDIPFGWLLGAFVVTAGLAWPATGRRCGPAGISAALLGAQATLHLAFSLPLRNPEQPPGHPHPPGPPPRGPGAALPGTPAHGPGTAGAMPGGMTGGTPDAMADAMAGSMPGTLPGGMADVVGGAMPGVMGHEMAGAVGGTAAGAMARAMGDATAGTVADMSGHGAAGMAGMAGHGGGGMADMADMAGHGVAGLVAMAGHGGIGMIAAHVLAGLLCALWLAWGEAAVFRLAGALGATALLAARPLARALALVRTRVALVPAPPAHCPPYERPRRLRGAVHAHTAVRRGPPGWGNTTRTTAPGRPARA